MSEGVVRLAHNESCSRGGEVGKGVRAFEPLFRGFRLLNEGRDNVRGRGRYPLQNGSKGRVTFFHVTRSNTCLATHRARPSDSQRLICVTHVGVSVLRTSSKSTTSSPGSSETTRLSAHTGTTLKEITTPSSSRRSVEDAWENGDPYTLADTWRTMRTCELDWTR